MKPFDLEAARRGEPIVRYYIKDGRSIPLTYLGRMRCGLIVTEDEKGSLLIYDEAELRMAPRKRTLYIGIQSIGTSGPWFSVAEDADDWVEEFPATRRYIPVEVTE